MSLPPEKTQTNLQSTVIDMRIFFRETTILLWLQQNNFYPEFDQKQNTVLLPEHVIIFKTLSTTHAIGNTSLNSAKLMERKVGVKQ